jgi:hypothetical protein
MKKLLTLILMLALFVFACQSKHNKQEPGIITKAIPAKYKPLKTVPVPSNNQDINEQKDAYADYYVVVVDTGTDYYALRDKMFTVKQSTGIPIDTMDRHYDKSKNLIILPDTSSDEIYAGDYIPRRYPSENLSLEYMTVYKQDSKEKTIGLIAGIYEKKTSADSALNIISAQKEAFEFKSKVYVGCMH